MTTYKPTPLYGPNGTIAYNADGTKAMTTNKPEIVAWGSFYRGVMQDFGYNKEATKAAAKLDFHGCTLSIEPLIRLSDYEALQAECTALVEALQNLVHLYYGEDRQNQPGQYAQAAVAALAAHRKQGGDV